MPRIFDNCASCSSLALNRSLDTGRAKDYLRIAMFLEQDAVDMRSLKAVLRRFGLTQKWKENEYRFKL